MPWTLWRAIFIDVARLVLMSTAVLVLITSFAIAIKPLADGLLQPGEAVRFMLFATIPMLSYALPFAAGFGTTLAYHRYSSENEVVAMHASGISHVGVLVPALVMGVVLAGSLTLINDQIIPRFLRKMEVILTDDFIEMQIRAMEGGEAANFGNFEIHADAVASIEPEPGSRYLQQFLLSGVGFVELDKGEEGDEESKDGRVINDGTAQRAWVVLVPPSALTEEFRARIGPDANAIILKFEGANGTHPRFRGGVETYTHDEPIRVPYSVKDDPKFLTAGELRALRKEPKRMNFIDAKRMDVARAMARDLIADNMRARLGDTGVGFVRFEDQTGRMIRIEAGGINTKGGEWELRPIPRDGVINIEVRSSDGRIIRETAESATLIIEGADADDPLGGTGTDHTLFTLVASNIVDVDSGSQAPSATRSSLALEQDPIDKLKDKSCAEIAWEAEKNAVEGSPDYRKRIADPLEKLNRELAKLDREITSKQHERLAYSVACLVMVVTGGVMALILKESLPLVVYLWSFFPALITVVLISSGQSATHDAGAVGLPMLWGGVVGLGIYTLLKLRVLRRH